MKILTQPLQFALIKTWSYLSIIIILLSLIVTTLYQSKLPIPTNNYTKRLHQEYMSNLTVTHFTETGVIKDQIYASYWAYIPSLQNSTLTNPKMHIIKPNGAKWLIQANYAKAWHTTLGSHFSKLKLNKSVVIERLQTNKFVPIVMKTEQITYFPDDEFVETKKYVEMTKPGLFLSGIGLKGYLDKDVMQLLDKVKTNYETTS